MRALALAVVAVLLQAPAARADDQYPLATCFWEGPISTDRPTTRGFDGRSFNYPEESATYWLARFTLPEGTTLRLRGRYPHGRYMSLNSYSDGAPTDALSDPAIAPEPGHVNPFVTGARRDARARSWTLRVLDQAPPDSPQARAPNTLYARAAPGQPIELLYRVYEPDDGSDLTGGVGLPAIDLVRAGGSAAGESEACGAINHPDRSIPVQTVPAAGWRAATSCRPGHPAFDPVRWERFFNLDYATVSVPADCTEAGFATRRSYAPPVQGGLYSNLDTAYVFAHLSRSFGEIVVVSGVLPSFPPTREGQRTMAPADMRFWSLCTGESRVTVRTPDCLADRQVALDRDRRFTIVVSRTADRPANARQECGVSWLDWGDRGDGAGREDYGLLVLRNMLVSPAFAHAVQRVPRPGAEAVTMGPYLPHAGYSSRAAFEARGCVRPRASASRLRGLPSNRHCMSGRRLRLRLAGPDERPLRSATVRANGRRVRLRRSRGRLVGWVRVRRRLTLRVLAVLDDGRRVVVTRRYRGCGRLRPQRATRAASPASRA